MQFHTLEYFDSKMEQMPETLTIDMAGYAHYESHSNVATPTQPEIGIYAKRLSSDEIDSLRLMLDHPPLRDLVDHWGRVLPSDHYKRIRVTTDTETIEKLIGTKEPVAPPLHALFDRLDQLVAQVRTQPQQTLRSTLAQVSIGANGELTAEIALSNSGTQTVFYRNPASLVGAADGELTIQLWPERPPGSLRAEDVSSAEVHRVTAIRLPARGQPDAKVIEILPGEAISFRLHGTVSLPQAGVYLARSRYMTTAAEVEGHQPLVGEVFSITVAVHVVKN